MPRPAHPACDGQAADGRLGDLGRGARDVLFPFTPPGAPPAPPAWPGPAWREGLRELGRAASGDGDVAEALDRMEAGLEAERASRDAALSQSLRWRAAGAALVAGWWLAGLAAAVSLAILGHDAAGVLAACCLPLPTLAILAADLARGRA